MPDYRYMPIIGDLPGKSFENQTVAFFESLQNQLDTLASELYALKLRVINNGEATTKSLNDHEKSINVAQSTADKGVGDAAAAKTAASKAQSTADKALSTADKALSMVDEALQMDI